MFLLHAGKTKTVWLPVTPSTDLAKDTILTFTSGKLVAATAGTTAANTVGLLAKEIATTDDDYADDRLVPVEVPIEKHCIYIGDVTSGLVATDIGGEFDLTDAATVNRGASSIDMVKCVGRISATKGYFMIKLNGSY